MKKIAAQIESAVQRYAVIISALDDHAFAHKNAGKWSKKEILGHLCDSAQNNLQRFIRAQYELVPPAIVYQQDSWVALTHYQGYPHQQLVRLWEALNIHICHVLRHMDESHYENRCLTGESQSRPLTFFAEDYLRHMLHHLQQISPTV